MSLISVYFLIFILLLIPVYYLVPKKIQWCILLLASLFFYSFCGMSSLLILIVIAAVSYLSAKRIQRFADDNKEYIKSNSGSLTKEDKKTLKAAVKKKTGTVLALNTVFIVLVMLFFKVVPIINGGGERDVLRSIIVPLGLSYFSLQAIGYVTDVYRGVFTAENNFFRFLLFLSFFPQIIQGPINEWSKLSKDLFSEHRFDSDIFSYGFYRMLWGFYKKMVLADTMTPYISNLFSNYRLYTSPTLILGTLLCMMHLYADFSGYMDIVCGISEMMGIGLTENFKQPFFSRSLSEFWTRWHISLGAWFRSYVFYPVGKSGLTKRVTAKCTNIFGPEFAERIPTTMGLVAVWGLIGIWHGVTAPFIIWGLASGTIMILSLWLEPVYNRVKHILKISDESIIWKIFQMIRTLLLVSYLEVFADSSNISEGWGYILCSVTNTWKLTSLATLTPFIEYQRSGAVQELVCIILGFFVMSVISIYQLHGKFRDFFARIPMFLRAVIMTGLFYVIIIIGVESVINNSGGFLYATF